MGNFDVSYKFCENLKDFTGSQLKIILYVASQTIAINSSSTLVQYRTLTRAFGTSNPTLRVAFALLNFKGILNITPEDSFYRLSLGEKSYLLDDIPEQESIKVSHHFIKALASYTTIEVRILLLFLYQMNRMRRDTKYKETICVPYISYRIMEDMAGINSKSAIKGIKSLEKKGCIEVEKGDNKREKNIYFLRDNNLLNFHESKQPRQTDIEDNIVPDKKTYPKGDWLRGFHSQEYLDKQKKN